MATQAGDSSYNSLQTKVQKRLTAASPTLATFTWGKIMTDDGNPPLGFVGTHNGASAGLERFAAKSTRSVPRT